MDRKVISKIGIAMVFLFAMQVSVVLAQSMGYGHGMMGGYGMGMMGYGEQVNIPDKLPKPKSDEWISKLKEVLSLEKMSQAQYEADRIKYKVHMPYGMIGLQEIDHIAWIEGLLSAYGVSTNVKMLAIKDTKTLADAYKNAMQLENNLIPLDEWLIKNSPDETATEVMDTILLQTRMHYSMFSHALQMVGLGGKGGMMGGYGMGMGYGHGMMGGRGMTGGYGMGMGYGHGMMGGYGVRSNPECSKYFDETTDQRKKLLDMNFKYAEASRDPKTTIEQLDKIGNEIIELQTQLYQKMPANCR